VNAKAVRAGDFRRRAHHGKIPRQRPRCPRSRNKAHPDGERHPNGYKQLEMHIEAGLREVQDLLTAAPEPYQPPLESSKPTSWNSTKKRSTVFSRAVQAKTFAA